MPSTSDVDVVRRLYQAINDRDLAAAGRCFAPDALWHLPGDSPIAGDHRGWAQIRDNFMGKLGPMSGNTFRAELVDVALGAEGVQPGAGRCGADSERCPLATARRAA